MVVMEVKVEVNCDSVRWKEVVYKGYMERIINEEND